MGILRSSPALAALACLLVGCAQLKIDFACEVPGDAIVYVDNRAYQLPQTITFPQMTKALRMALPGSNGQTVQARGRIDFDPSYRPTDVDQYARLRAVISRDLIRTIEDGGAAVFYGNSASNQKVFRLLFGKE
jgi:hypothetical protein